VLLEEPALVGRETELLGALGVLVELVGVETGAEDELPEAELPLDAAEELPLLPRHEVMVEA